MDNSNTIIYVRIKGKRPPDFVDPEPLEWNDDKDKQLWEFISKLDNSIDQINWTKLSTMLNAPKFFLRERSYKLFENHMLLMKRQLNAKKLAPVDSGGKFDIFKNSSVVKESKINMPITNNSSVDLLVDRSMAQNVITKNNELENDEYIESDEKLDQANLYEKSTSDILNQLHVSKVLGKSLHSTKNKGLNELKEEPDSDLSSSLNVSKSALEEALLERLRF